MRENFVVAKLATRWYNEHADLLTANIFESGPMPTP
jgi:hypothetical protein